MTHKNKHEHEDEHKDEHEHEDKTADRGGRRGRGRGGAGEAERAQDPVAELDVRYSAEGARAPEWSEARARLAAAEVFWLSTVRPDGRPHVTPLLSVWLDGALHFCTGPDERKARNLAANSHCVLTTGCNVLSEGIDLVVEGHAVRVTDEAKLVSLAGTYETKYGSDWHFDVRDGAFHGDGGEALVFEVAPVTAFAFTKGDYAQTRWRFAE